MFLSKIKLHVYVLHMYIYLIRFSVLNVTNRDRPLGHDDRSNIFSNYCFNYRGIRVMMIVTGYHL